MSVKRLLVSSGIVLVAPLFLSLQANATILIDDFITVQNGDRGIEEDSLILLARCIGRSVDPQLRRL